MEVEEEVVEEEVEEDEAAPADPLETNKECPGVNYGQPRRGTRMVGPRSIWHHSSHSPRRWRPSRTAPRCRRRRRRRRRLPSRPSASSQCASQLTMAASSITATEVWGGAEVTGGEDRERADPDQGATGRWRAESRSPSEEDGRLLKTALSICPLSIFSF